MPQPFLALITPIGGGEQPPYPSQGPGFPTHPIAGVPPGGAWPQPPGAPVYPSHPIHSGPGGEIGGPPGIWGGGNVPFPTPPIYIPIEPPEGSPHPEHPIYIPINPGGPPPNLAEIKKKLEFLLGNLPTDPNPKPEPV